MVGGSDAPVPRVVAVLPAPGAGVAVSVPHVSVNGSAVARPMQVGSPAPVMIRQLVRDVPRCCRGGPVVVARFGLVDGRAAADGERRGRGGDADLGREGGADLREQAGAGRADRGREVGQRGGVGCRYGRRHCPGRVRYRSERRRQRRCRVERRRHAQRRQHQAEACRRGSSVAAQLTEGRLEGRASPVHEHVRRRARQRHDLGDFRLAGRPWRSLRTSAVR